MHEYKPKGCQGQMVKKKIISDKGNCITPIKRLATFGEGRLSKRFFIQTFNILVRKKRKTYKEKESIAALSLRKSTVLQKKKNLAWEDLITIVNAAEKFLTLIYNTKFVIY